MNINNGCGSTHLEKLASAVVAGGYDIGVAFDGDADRCLLVDENGQTIDGDKVMAVCATDMKRRGVLNGDTIVATVMSNLGLHEFCRNHGLNLVCTAVQVLAASGKKASELASCCATYPQVLVNVEVPHSGGVKEKIMASDALKEAVKQEEDALGGEGRVLVRPSGTEALIRVMVEAKTEEIASDVAQRLVNFIKSLKI